MNKPKNTFRLTIVALCCAHVVAAQDVGTPDVSEMLAELANPETENWQELEERISDQWSRSGSRTMDLLLERGLDAIEDENYGAAVEHLTALTDHAPDFAEGWNLRATAFFLMDEYGLALDDLIRALARNPKHFSAYFGAGVILEETGAPNAALRAYRAASAINPHRENVTEAIERLERMVEGWAL